MNISQDHTYADCYSTSLLQEHRFSSRIAVVDSERGKVDRACEGKCQELARLHWAVKRPHWNFAGTATLDTVTTDNPATSQHPLSFSTTNTAIMSDGEVEVESPAGYAVLPKEVTDEIGSIKLFNKAGLREMSTWTPY
jgi:hypothetical protein